MKKNIIYSLLFLILLLNSSNVTACMFWARNDSESLKRHDIVFLGLYEGCFSENKVSYSKYTTLKVWKGSIKKVYTSIAKECPISSTDHNNIGRQMIVFANKIENSDHINIPPIFCSLDTRQINPIVHSYLLGFELPSFFDYESEAEDLSELGTPIYVNDDQIKVK